jgi:hypothetical protein
MIEWVSLSAASSLDTVPLLGLGDKLPNLLLLPLCMGDFGVLLPPRSVNQGGLPLPPLSGLFGVITLIYSIIGSHNMNLVCVFNMLIHQLHISIVLERNR